MFTLIFAEILQNFKRVWKMYLTNIICIMLIILLFAYIEGSRRQLNLQNTVFSGEIVLKMKENTNAGAITEDVSGILTKSIKDVKYIATKIRSDVQYRLPGNNNNGAAEMIGVDLAKDKNLAEYLTLTEGRFLKTGRDILIPSSILLQTDIKIGDLVKVTGKNSDEVYNAASFKVCGIYNSPGLSVFSKPRLLVTYDSMNNYYMPKENNKEYCLFFKSGKIPDSINKDIQIALNDEKQEKIDSIEAMRISSWDVLNISVQFNMFMILMIILTIVVVITVVILINFNIYMILFRKRQKQIGTLMSFGVKSWKIGLTLFLESVIQILISSVTAVILCQLIAVLGRQQMAGGFLEILFVLLSGTNRLDFYIKFYQIWNAVIIILGAVTISQIPIFLKILTASPIEVIQNK